MTREEILAMEPGPELDRLVAEQVMGFDDTNFQYDWEMGISERIKHNDFLDEDIWVSFNPSTDISAAWEVVEKMCRESLKFSFRLDFHYVLNFARFIHNDSSPEFNDGEFESQSAPEAICKAALLAVMEGKDEES